MNAKLPKELTDALHAAKDQQLEVVDPETAQVYVIVESAIHKQAMETLRREQDRSSIAQGIAEMEAGLGVPSDEAFDLIREKLGLRQQTRNLLQD